MREIKFRAWDRKRGRMRFGNDNLLISLGGLLFWDVGYKEPDMLGEDESQDYTLMQYTGLKDKNGVGIYEGDVLSSHEPRWPAAGHQDCSGVVAWRDEYAHYGCGRWKLDTGNINYLQLEVIGNIHENPELLN